MIYRSNLACVDLAPRFKHLHSRVMGHSMGHDVPSDWADKADDDPWFGIYKRCGMWTHDEAAILYACAKYRGHKAWRAVDIGAHSGWTTAHIALAGYKVDAVDPLLANGEFYRRFRDNTSSLSPEPIRWGEPAEEFFSDPPTSYYDFICIDGDHEPGAPLDDADNAAAYLADTGVIMLHDGVGRPVREAVEWLMQEGFKARAYFTPHLVFCCWRGDFTPPDHVPDPLVKAQHLDGRYEDFSFEVMA